MPVLKRSSVEYHQAHLAFARVSIVEAAANHEPILARLLDYTSDVAKAEQDRIGTEVERLKAERDGHMTRHLDTLGEVKRLREASEAIKARGRDAEAEVERLRGLVAEAFAHENATRSASWRARANEALNG